MERTPTLEALLDLGTARGGLKSVLKVNRDLHPQVQAAVTQLLMDTEKAIREAEETRSLSDDTLRGKWVQWVCRLERAANDISENSTTSVTAYIVWLGFKWKDIHDKYPQLSDVHCEQVGWGIFQQLPMSEKTQGKINRICKVGSLILPTANDVAQHEHARRVFRQHSAAPYSILDWPQLQVAPSSTLVVDS
jgi:hypothetical protein